jgi:DNA recombination protein RmuC
MPLPLPLEILAVVGVALLGALLLGFALGRVRAGAQMAQLAREKSELSTRLVANEEQTRAARHEAAELRVRLDEEMQQRAASQALSVRIPELERELTTRREEASRLAADHAALKATLDEERRAGADKMALLDQAEERLRDTFRALSAEVLKSNNESFLELARSSFAAHHETAKGELAQRQQAIESMLRPVRESLDRFGQSVGEIEKSRIGAYESLREQLRQLGEANDTLRQQTASLVNSLRSPVARGRWGEVQLRRVVEMTGMLSHCDFVEQAGIGDSRLRPDMIVRLPGGKTVLVDAKAPLEAYLRAVDAVGDDDRRRLLGEHAGAVRGHMRRLGAKEYWAQSGATPDFVIMFLPGEAFFSAALQSDPELIEFGAAEKVVPATPTTLIALLRSVQYGWSQERIAANAQAVSELGRELYNRMNTLFDHVGGIGNGLEKAVRAYNEAVGSLERKVLPQARRFKELGVTAQGVEIEPLQPVERAARTPAAPELLPPVRIVGGEPGT